MLLCEPLPYEDVPWTLLDSFPDRTVFQTRAWLEYLRESQGAIPCVLTLKHGAATAGYFTGALFRRFGIPFLGSPFPGWGTPYMGFNLAPGISRADALEAVESFAFHEMHCRHIEIADPGFHAEDGGALDFASTSYNTYTSDLTLSEDDLFSRMDSACRRCIRKADKE